MSLTNLLGDLFSGNFTNVEARLKNWWDGLSPGIQATITTLETGEGKILQGLVGTAASDVLKNGLNTASFVAAATDVGSKLLAQNITLAQTTIFTALNAEVGAQAAAAGVAVPTNAGTAVIVPVVVPVAPAS